jgi:hypothetical protein
MARKLQKAKISLSANKKSEISPASGKLIKALRDFSDTPPKTSEGVIAFTDEDTSARYIRLKEKV